jgi:hypothetical protein
MTIGALARRLGKLDMLDLEASFGVLAADAQTAGDSSAHEAYAQMSAAARAYRMRAGRCLDQREVAHAPSDRR